MKSILLSIFICQLMFISANFANAQTQEFQNALGLNVGANYSDMNYGNEFLYDYMPRMDYLLFSSGADSGYGYYAGIQYSRKLTSHILIHFGAAYQQLGYSVEAEVFDLSPNVNRPPSADIPVSANGYLNYHFLDLNAAFEYSLSKYVNRGLYLKLNANYLNHLNTTWNLDLVFEDQSSGSDTDFSKITEPDYNSIVLLGIGFGYHISLSEKLSISPEVNLSYGLNSLVTGAEEINPTMALAGISLRRWF